jgi:hypothetical protein
MHVNLDFEGLGRQRYIIGLVVVIVVVVGPQRNVIGVIPRCRWLHELMDRGFLCHRG